MAGFDWLGHAPLALFAGGLALVVLALLAIFGGRQRSADASVFAGPGAGRVFLFEAERLVDATPGARQVLSLAEATGSAWERLMQVLLPRFPDLREVMGTLVDCGTLALTSSDGRTRIEAEWRMGLARLTLVDVDRADTDVTVDRQALEALEAELSVLRGIAGGVPYLTWTEAADGRITWANAAYLDLSARQGPDSPVPLWPPHRLFPKLDAASAEPRRVSLPGDGKDGRDWFDLSACAVPGGVLRVAAPADAIVQAERSRAEFVQTLTKTFASLTVGLAIFDRSRRLQLFNPALADLTGLPPAFLIQRPGLTDFIDRLREARILPEPKNFASWRQRLWSLESQAEQGTFAETWTLPDGQVFEVTGRPHPDGAIAFLIKDVSAEMRLTRRFRGELQLHQAVLDQLDQAVAVFGADGALMQSNAAYNRMWGFDPQLATQDMTLAEALRLWRTNCPTTPDWGRLGDAAAAGPTPLDFQAERLNGRRLSVRMKPLPGGAQMVIFTEEEGVRSLPSRTRSPRRALAGHG